MPKKKAIIAYYLPLIYKDGYREENFNPITNCHDTSNGQLTSATCHIKNFTMANPIILCVAN